MEPQVFLYILSSISAGLTALGGNLNYFTGIRVPKKAGKKWARFGLQITVIISKRSLISLYNISF